MLNIRICGDRIQISGTFDFGYMGTYHAEQIHFYLYGDGPDELREWRIVADRPGPDSSDGFGEFLLCGAYDVLDEALTFTEWHNH